MDQFSYWQCLKRESRDVVNQANYVRACVLEMVNVIGSSKILKCFIWYSYLINILLKGREFVRRAYVYWRKTFIPLFLILESKLVILISNYSLFQHFYGNSIVKYCNYDSKVITTFQFSYKFEFVTKEGRKMSSPAPQCDQSSSAYILSVPVYLSSMFKYLTFWKMLLCSSKSLLIPQSFSICISLLFFNLVSSLSRSSNHWQLIEF